MPVDFMHFVSTQQRTSKSVTALKVGWTELKFPDILAFLVEIKQIQSDKIIIHFCGLVNKIYFENEIIGQNLDDIVVWRIFKF